MPGVLTLFAAGGVVAAGDAWVHSQHEFPQTLHQETLVHPLPSLIAAHGTKCSYFGLDAAIAFAWDRVQVDPPLDPCRRSYLPPDG